ncbi:hypothetical protein LguiB_001035 [Lonicera macranthoides]
MPLSPLTYLNNLTSSSQTLQPGREILIPITCSCSGQFFSANFTYVVPQGTTLPEIACGDFEGLVKSITLLDKNPSQKSNISLGLALHVPLKCACPDNFSSGLGVRYLVTYPLLERDNTKILAAKFGISLDDIWAANNMAPIPTVYPETTVLVPLKKEPSINFSVQDSEPPNPSFLPTLPVKQTAKKTREMTLYIVISVVGACLVVVALITSGLYLKGLKELKAKQALKSLSLPTSCSTPRSSPISGPTTRNSSNNSCLSPDLLVGIKYTLCNYTSEEMRRATNYFNEENKVQECVYKGLIDNSEVIIKQLRFEDTREVIDLHSKINHVNIVRLQGVCYGEDDSCWSCLVFEFPTGGCLRDCLANTSGSLRWHRRTQIAFDIATGLHYLHYCMVPQYTHRSISSENIFLTPKLRAKMAVFGGPREDVSISSNIEGWIALEKVDIYAFGVVLLELISGRENIEGNLLQESIGFLGGGGGEEGGCFEQLRNFMDPGLKEDYPLAEALCLAVLAKACVEDDPLHRPSMDDILKVLARMI